MILTQQQGDAINAAVRWYKNDTKSQPVFKIYGYAGVGKSTIVQFIVNELDCRACYGALTGKAARVLRLKGGLPAQTIHRLIYRYLAPPGALLEQLENSIARLKALGDEDNEIPELRRQLKELQQPAFTLNPEAPVYDVDLVVLDECSMIDTKMAEDLLSFGKPLLILGDPGQLPPINNVYGFSDIEPDVFLTQIHRQALDSPIIRLATMARENVDIPFDEYSDVVYKFPKKAVPYEALVNFDQILCGKHVTRRAINNSIRKTLGFTSPLPSGPDEKIIITANRPIFNLLNGMIASFSHITEKDERRFFADITIPDEEDGGRMGVRPIYSGHFLDHKEVVKDRASTDWRASRTSVEADFGYAITTHKAQGSSWDQVAIVDDGWGWSHKDQRAQWLYTAITRSERALWILA